MVDKSLLLPEPRLPRSKMGTFLACILHRVMVSIRDLRIQNTKTQMVTGESSDSNTNPLFQTGYNLGKGSSLGKGEPRLTKEVAGGAQTQNALGHSLPLTSVSKSQQSVTYTDGCPDTSPCPTHHVLSGH